MITAVYFMISFLLAVLLTAAVIPCLNRLGIVDIPNKRSSHQIPRPRGGGAAILATILVVVFVASRRGESLPGAGFGAGAFIVAVLGFWDDLRGGLSVKIRLAVQAAAAGLIIFFYGPILDFSMPEPFQFLPGMIGTLLAFLWIMGVTNIYNFLDGIDGYAGTQAVIAGVGLTLYCGAAGAGILGAAIAGAAAGFLIFNWHPARIFMGDVGAYGIGFLFACVPFEYMGSKRVEMVMVVALLLWFFLADGALTIFRRGLRRQNMMQAHRSHIYQRLVKAGLRHDRVVMLGAAGMILVASAAVWGGKAYGIKGLCAAGGLAGVVFIAYYGSSLFAEHRWLASHEREVTG